MANKLKHAGNTIAYSLLIEALLDEAYAHKELVKISGLAETTVWKFVHAARRRGIVYIAAWKKDALGRYTIPVYSLGRRPDTPRPRPLTAAERSAKRNLLAMTRGYDMALRGAPRPGAESKTVEETTGEPSA